MDHSPIYISGPMSNLPAHNFPAFNAAADQLRAAGYDVLNPAAYGEGEMTWADYLRRDLRDVLNAGGVAVLSGWQNSRGACLEVHVADELGVPTMSVDEWIDLADLMEGEAS